MRAEAHDARKNRNSGEILFFEYGDNRVVKRTFMPRVRLADPSRSDLIRACREKWRILVSARIAPTFHRRV
jgi:hypothetical protein